MREDDLRELPDGPAVRAVANLLEVYRPDKGLTPLYLRTLFDEIGEALGFNPPAPERTPTDITMLSILAEVRRARAKFPGNEKLLAALMEEVGELAQAMLQRKDADEVRKEAVQVACVAVRLIEEGDSDFARETWDAAA